jgi:ankyrin repeat protein
LPEENCTTHAANEDRDLVGPYGFGRIFQLRSQEEGHQERGTGIGLKRVLAVGLIVVFLCSVSVASAAGSLLHFDHEWTEAEVRARIAAGADLNRTDESGWTALMMAAP